MKTTAELRVAWVKELRDAEKNGLASVEADPGDILDLIEDIAELEEKLNRGSRRVDLLTGKRVEMEQGDE
jgi:hypothetical protein